MKRLCESTWWIYVLVAVALLPAMVLRDFTPDNELRYLSIADEALENGSVWCFYNHGELYADKPPLYLWIVMLGRMLFGGGCMWFLGLFSLVPMLIVGRVMDGWARRRLSMAQRQGALLMLFTCGFFPGLGLTVRMDMLMTMWIVLALREAWRMAQGAPSRRHEALMGFYTFMALFTKGPYGVMIPVAATAAYLLMVRRGQLLRRIWGWPAWAVILGGCAVWFGSVYAEGGAPYIDNLLFHQTVDRANNAFTHQRPWWYYLVHVWYVMAPWSLLFAWQGIARRRIAARGDFRKMMLAVAGVTLVVLSCVSSKLQVYLLPMIPFGVYWGATLVDGERMLRAVRWVAVGVLGVVFAASWFLPAMNPRIGYGEVCGEVAALGPTEVIVDSQVRRGENIDAYFSVPVRVADSSAPSFALPRGAALILPGDDGMKLKYEFQQ